MSTFDYYRTLFMTWLYFASAIYVASIAAIFTAYCFYIMIKRE